MVRGFYSTEESETEQAGKGKTNGDQFEEELPQPHISLSRTVHTVHLLALCPTSTFLRWLCSHKDTPLISTLTLSRRSTFQASTNAFLRKLGGILQSLKITGYRKSSSFLVVWGSGSPIAHL